MRLLFSASFEKLVDRQSSTADKAAKGALGYHLMVRD